MSRQKKEFQHRTSIFEGAYIAWSCLGSLEPEAFKDADSSAVQSSNYTVHYEPLPRSGLRHPFVTCILSRWLGRYLDDEDLEQGLNNLRKWWQNRRGGQGSMTVKVLSTPRMKLCIAAYASEFFTVTHSFIIDGTDPPRSFRQRVVLKYPSQKRNFSVRDIPSEASKSKSPLATNEGENKPNNFLGHRKSAKRIKQGPTSFLRNVPTKATRLEILRTDKGHAFKDISIPHERDIIFQRDGLAFKHPGNVKFHKYLKIAEENYLILQKFTKQETAKEIVNIFRNLNPPTRFLQKNKMTGLWDDIGDERVFKKILQAFRKDRNDRTKEHMNVTTDLTEQIFLEEEDMFNDISEGQGERKTRPIDSVIENSVKKPTTQNFSLLKKSCTHNFSHLRSCTDLSASESLQSAVVGKPSLPSSDEKKQESFCNIIKQLPTAGLDDATTSALMAFQDIVCAPGSYIGAPRNDSDSKDDLLRSAHCIRALVYPLSPDDVLCYLRRSFQTMKDYQLEDFTQK
eukprot:CAMPEP_0194273622 /NCGR_PEP_ID=MMETSP0169-20130528/6924_1 /TAXON_ID=218684 /ORGANISM="Corethron pennatum, Strain L29A3" /LENGTH=511 /DNA_ID=CAMNT_0039016631 /DNA_START=255 /DNA_END=1790 /DNA_ORIENTATION=-